MTVVVRSNQISLQQRLMNLKPTEVEEKTISSSGRMEERNLSTKKRSEGIVKCGRDLWREIATPSTKEMPK